MKTLRLLRIAAAAVLFVLMTLLFLDFTGTVRHYAGWINKIQLVPAILAINGVILAGLVVLTLLLGRIYCSTICPLGVLQDAVAWGSRKLQKRKRYAFSPALNKLRYGLLVLFVAALVAGVLPLVGLLDPYSAYGRICANLFAPLYRWGNNLLAQHAQQTGSYDFYAVDVWFKSAVSFGVALVWLLGVAWLAWRNGRTYCNTVCPVGTALGLLSRFAVFKPRIDLSKCNGCHQCERNCKAACIDSKAHQIDYTRCVACMNCAGVCRQSAIGLFHGKRELQNS